MVWIPKLIIKPQARYSSLRFYHFRCFFFQCQGEKRQRDTTAGEQPDQIHGGGGGDHWVGGGATANHIQGNKAVSNQSEAKWETRKWLQQVKHIYLPAPKYGTVYKVLLLYKVLLNGANFDLTSILKRQKAK